MGELGTDTPTPAQQSGVGRNGSGGELGVIGGKGREHRIRTDGGTQVVVPGRTASGVDAVPEGSEVRAVFPGTSTEDPARRIMVVRTRR